MITAEEFDRKFDAGEDMSEFMDLSTAKRPNHLKKGKVMLLQKIIDEIKEIPEARQEELYKLIQEFRHQTDTHQATAEPYDTPDEEIIEGIKEGMRQALAGEVIPLEELWKEDDQPRTPGLLQGKLSDTFFEPLPESELQQWETAI